MKTTEPFEFFNLEKFYMGFWDCFRLFFCHSLNLRIQEPACKKQSNKLLKIFELEKNNKVLQIITTLVFPISICKEFPTFNKFSPSMDALLYRSCSCIQKDNSVDLTELLLS